MVWIAQNIVDFISYYVCCLHLVFKEQVSSATSPIRCGAGPSETLSSIP